ADFREHPAGRAFLPLAQAHDRDLFELVCYSGVRKPDALTERVRSLASTWRDIRNLSDEQLAAQVRDDRIDILIDLSLHTADGRLLAFARRPAPAQVTH